MPTRTNSDRIIGLETGLAALSQKVESLLADLARFDDRIDAASESARTHLTATEARMSAADSRVRDEVRELRAVAEQLRLDLAVTRRDLDAARTSRDEWGRRGWAAFAAVLGAVAGYFLKR